jgi:hypothetical protein
MRMFDYSKSDRRMVWDIINDQESEDRQMDLRCGLAIYDTLRIMLECIGELTTLVERIEGSIGGSTDELSR